MTNTQEKFAIYSSSGKYFVKYKDSEEREITQQEYNQLAEDKKRILDNLVNDYPSYMSRPTEVVLSDYTSPRGVKIKRFKHSDLDDATRIIISNGEAIINGLYTETQDCYVVESLYSTETQRNIPESTLLELIIYGEKEQKHIVFKNFTKEIEVTMKPLLRYKLIYPATNLLLII